MHLHRDAVGDISGVLQRIQHERLAATGRTHDHAGVAHDLRLVHLDALVHLIHEYGLVFAAEAARLEVVHDGRLETGVAHTRAVHAGEEVVDEAQEERHVLEDVLGHVGVAQRPHEHHVSGHDQHGLQGAQAEVVVVLLAELALGQLVEHRHLLGQRLGALEALREQHDLADLLQVRHDHGHGAEERLEVIGQLGAAGVARVHRDEEATGGEAGHALDADLGAHADIHGVPALDEAVLDASQLCRHHAEHLDVDAVELVEAAPGADLDQAREDASHRFVIQTLSARSSICACQAPLRSAFQTPKNPSHATITSRDIAFQTYHATKRQGLREVLRRLGLPCARRPRWRTTELEGQGLREGHVAPVGERRDDEAAVAAHVLVAVLELAGALADQAVVDVAVPVEAQLRLPRELLLIEDRVAHEAVHDVSRVHVDDQQGVDLLADDLYQLPPHHRDELIQLRREPCLQLLHAVLVAAGHFSEGVLHLPGPPDLRAGERYHAQRLLDPGRPGHVPVLVDALLGDGPQTGLHALLGRLHPRLHGAVHERRVCEGKALVLGGFHAHDGLVAATELQLLDVVEQLEHVDLNAGGVAGAQHGEQLIVGDEEEAREGVPLGVQVVAQGLLALVEAVAQALQRLQPRVRRAGVDGVGVLVRGHHDGLEGLVDGVELLGLLRQLQADVFRSDEDGLEIHPLALHDKPGVQALAYEVERALPAADAVDEGTHEARAAHGLEVEHVVLQLLLDVVRGAQHVAAVLAVLLVLGDAQRRLGPGAVDLAQLVLDLLLLHRLVHDFGDLLGEVVQLHGEDVLQRQRLGVHVEDDAGNLHERAPVPLLHGLVLEVHDQRDALLEVGDVRRHLEEDRQALELARQLAALPLQLVGALRERRDVQLAPQHVGVGLLEVVLLAEQAIHDAQLLHLGAKLGQRAEAGDGQTEEILGVHQLLLAPVALGQLRDVLVQHLGSLQQRHRRRAGTAVQEVAVELVAVLGEVHGLLLGDLSELVLHAAQPQVLGLAEAVQLVPALRQTPRALSFLVGHVDAVALAHAIALADLRVQQLGVHGRVGDAADHVQQMLQAFQVVGLRIQLLAQHLLGGGVQHLAVVLAPLVRHVAYARGHVVGVDAEEVDVLVVALLPHLLREGRVLRKVRLVVDAVVVLVQQLLEVLLLLRVPQLVLLVVPAPRVHVALRLVRGGGDGLVQLEHQLVDRRVVEHVVVEAVEDRLLVLVGRHLGLGQDARAVHPAAEALGGLHDVVHRVAEDLLDVHERRAQDDVLAREAGLDDADGRAAVGAGQHGEEGGHGSHDHLGDGVEHALLPVVVVAAQHGTHARAGAGGDLFDFDKELIHRFVHLRQALHARQALALHAVVEVRHVKHLRPVAGLVVVRLRDQRRVLDARDHLRDHRAGLVHLRHHVVELVELSVAHVDVVGNALGRPVQRRKAVRDVAAELGELLPEQRALHGAEGLQQLVIRLEDLIEPPDAVVVLFLLQRHQQRALRDREAHAVQVLALANDLGELRREVHAVRRHRHANLGDGVGHAFVGAHALLRLHRRPGVRLQDGLLELLHHDVLGALLPVGEELAHVGVRLAREAKVALLHLLAEAGMQQALVLLEPQDRLLGALVQVPSPLDGAGDLGEVAVGLAGRAAHLPEVSDVVQLLLVLQQDVLVALVQVLVDGIPRLDVLEVLDQLEGRLGRAQLLEALLDEGAGHLVDLRLGFPELAHDASPLLLVLLREDVEGHRVDLVAQVLDHGDDAVDALGLARHRTKLGAQELLEIGQDGHDFQQVLAHGLHVIRALEELGAGELPAVGAVAVLDHLAHVVVGVRPGLEHLDGLLDQLGGVLGVSEDRADLNLLDHLVRDLPGDALHQGRHALVFVVVSRDDPHHPDRVHHAWQGIQNGQEVALLDVLEVALECVEELHVVLGLRIQLAQLRVVVHVGRVERDLLVAQHGQHHLYVGHVDLLVQSAEGGVAGPPELDLRDGAGTLRVLLALLLNQLADLLRPTFHGLLQRGHHSRVPDLRIVGTLDLDIWHEELDLALDVLKRMLQLLLELVHGSLELGLEAVAPNVLAFLAGSRGAFQRALGLDDGSVHARDQVAQGSERVALVRAVLHQLTDMLGALQEVSFLEPDEVHELLGRHCVPREVLQAALQCPFHLLLRLRTSVHRLPLDFLFSFLQVFGFPRLLHLQLFVACSRSFGFRRGSWRLPLLPIVGVVSGRSFQLLFFGFLRGGPGVDLHLLRTLPEEQGCSWQALAG
eukprot:scaffold58_cov256-Pinguiococcus_pyrenoidosus.AAC.12